MLLKLLLTACLTAAFCVVQTARVHAMGGALRKPGIAIPSAVEGGELDPTAAAMNKVLAGHEKQFAGGHFINARSVLHFTGGTKTINSLLDELSQIDGAVLHIHFSKQRGSSDSPFAVGPIAAAPIADGERQAKVCDCAIEHNAWANAQQLSITIYLGGDVALDELNLPAILGAAKLKK